MFSLLFNKDIILELVHTWLLAKINPYLHATAFLSSLSIGDLTPSLVTGVIIGIATVVAKIIEIRNGIKKFNADELRAQEETRAKEIRDSEAARAHEARQQELHEMKKRLLQDGDLQQLEELLSQTQP